MKALLTLLLVLSGLAFGIGLGVAIWSALAYLVLGVCFGANLPTSAYIGLGVCAWVATATARSVLRSVTK